MHGERLPERRAIQRDWLGHIMQASVIIITTVGLLGVPVFAAWNDMRGTVSDLRATIATLSAREDRAEHDISDQRQAQTLVSGQLSDANNKLTRIDTLLGEMRERLPVKR